MIGHIHEWGEVNLVLVKGRNVVHVRSSRLTLCGVDGYIMEPAYGYELPVCSKCAKGEELVVDVVMEVVDQLPINRGGRRGYLIQAEKVQNQLRSMPGQSVLIARDNTRNTLDSLNKHLKILGGVRTIVAISDKDETGPTEYSLYGEFDETVAPTQPK